MTNMTSTSLPISTSQREMTIRGLILGALITVVFTASNIYLGLKIGLTVASSIPAAVISMSVLRMMGGATILENNLVQTQASAAGTLSCVFISFPCLVMIGYWQHFPYLETMLLSMVGGMTGVLFTVPLRRAMVTHSSLPYPEGVAAAEILKAGSETGDPDSLKALLTGGLMSAVVTLATDGLRLLADGAAMTATWGGAVFRASTGFSLALLGAGYLVGIAGGIAMLLGAVIAWGVAVPILSTILPNPSHLAPADFATALWAQKVRFMGAGTISIAAIWTLAMLARPVAAGIRDMLRAGATIGDAGDDRDLAPRTLGLLAGALLLVLFGLFVAFQVPAATNGHAIITAALAAVAFCALFGFLVAAACGYMAGIVGSSSSPLSGIAIIATVMIASFLLLLEGLGLLPAEMSANGHHLAIAFALFLLSAIVASTAISNDNLQDLKTGQLVGASPWRQQAALLVGCASGAIVIPPVLELLYQAYGFVGAMPRPGMDASHALAAPQPALLVTLTTGIFLHQLDWTMILLGVGLGAVLIATDLLLRRRGGALPPLAVGIGLYLPPAVSVTLAIGAVLGWACTRRATQGGRSAHAETGTGTMLASGFIVGESLTGVLLAAIAGATGRDDTLSVLPAEAGMVPGLLGFGVFVAICIWFGRSIRRG